MGPSQTGIVFTNLLSEGRSLTNQIYLNGSGVAAGDVDGDGLCDLYFCGLDSHNVLYRNLGNWRFEEITEAAGVACADQASTGAAFVDIDGDGDLDLLVNGIAHGTRLFLNDGKGRFHEVTAESGLKSGFGGMSLALADINGDGLLDLYVVNYRNDTMRDMPDLRFRAGMTNGVYRIFSVNNRSVTEPDLVGRFSVEAGANILENGQPDVLYRNLGQGRFEPVSWTNGAFLDERGTAMETPYDWGLSAMFRDLNGDGVPDIYVCNDFQSPDRIWLNDGHGHFRAIARDAIRQTSLFSMGVDFADIDRDGLDDFFVADMLSPDYARRQVQVMDPAAFAQVRNIAGDRPQFSRNTLFHNRGNSSYAEIAQLAGVEASDWSWCPVFLDVDLDGYEDLLITTGHWRDAQNADTARELDNLKRSKRMSAAEELQARKRFSRLDTPNHAFRNSGHLTFDEVGQSWGFDSRRISHGMALADLDNDGDLDLVVNCLNDGPLLYRNETPRPRVAVRLRGQAPNTRGVGAKIRVLAPGLPAQSQEMICGGRYLSSDDFMRTFAAGSATNRVTVEVTWRSGARSFVTNAPANAVLEIDELGAERVSALAKQSNEKPSFADVSPLLNHQHIDEPFDDFARQPLLPHKLSQAGPAVAWIDFNGDGWEDLLIGTGHGGRLAAFRNDGKGGFIPQRSKLLETPGDCDLSGILGWRPNPTNLVLLLGLDRYETDSTNGPALRQLSLVSGKIDDSALQSAGDTGPLALADFDGDGDLDLFVGGRCIAGRYPEAASSVLLRNQHGRLEFDPEASRPFVGVGLVNSAVFFDFDNDGWPDLALACEWGPIRMFHNRHGTFEPWDAPVVMAGQSTSLGALTGWWNSIAVGDFDNDGRLDLIVGNWGRNTARQRFLQQPVRLYYSSADPSGNVPILEAWTATKTGSYFPARDWATLGSVFPLLQEHYTSFASFSAASIPEMLSSGLPAMKEVNAATLDSLLLLNRGDHFEAEALPIEAQVSPIFGLAVGDLDGDGNEDLFCAQNFFSVAPSESRQDAGIGLWLRGNGRGEFSAVPPNESGLAIYGEGRAAALSDFDHDGRLDLVVSQNRGPTKLYHNQTARPGLRVHLEGPAENLQAVGAMVRILFPGSRTGPVHQIQLGGGYWSQDATDIVLGIPKEPEALEIRWPGGFTERVQLDLGTRIFSRTLSSSSAKP